MHTAANRPNATPRLLRPKAIEGAPEIRDGQRVRDEFSRGPFYYQYVRPDGRSRVMVCDKLGESLQIASNVDAGARLLIQHYEGEKRGSAPRDRNRRELGVELRPSAFAVYEPMPAPVLPKPPRAGVMQLNGEPMRSPGALEHLFSKGPFRFQLLEPIEPIDECASEESLSILKSLVPKRKIVARSI